jgi:predicted DCC family thiol-disulfide oxidoreductase YuxK
MRFQLLSEASPVDTAERISNQDRMLHPVGRAGETRLFPPGVDLEVFFDGDCPLCLREISMLRRMDRKQRVLFTDIASPEFEPAQFGRSMDELMAEIHARLPDGSWITGVEVFRRLYSAVGFGWLMPLTRIPGISHGLEWGYRVFARNRLKLTGRCNSTCEMPRQHT